MVGRILEECQLSTSANLNRLKDVCAIGASNELKADALYSALDTILERSDAGHLTDRVAGELRRFLESELSLQKTRSAILDSLDALLKGIQETARPDVADRVPGQTDPRSDDSLSQLPEVDLDELRDALSTDQSEANDTGEPAWLSEVVSLSTAPREAAVVPAEAPLTAELTGGSLGSDDPWSTLHIPTFYGHDPLPPIPALKTNGGHPSPQEAKGPRREHVAAAPRIDPVESGELEKALDRLLSKPPTAVPPPVRETNPLASLRVDFATSGVLRCGQRLFPIRTTELGLLSITVEVADTFEVGTVMHIFFELGDGGQIGVNCELLSVLAKAGQQNLQLKYLDLLESDKQRIQRVIESRR